MSDHHIALGMSDFILDVLTDRQIQGIPEDVLNETLNRLRFSRYHYSAIAERLLRAECRLTRAARGKS